jgi:hypothetical protein
MACRSSLPHALIKSIDTSAAKKISRRARRNDRRGAPGASIRIGRATASVYLKT